MVRQTEAEVNIRNKRVSVINVLTCQFYHEFQSCYRLCLSGNVMLLTCWWHSSQSVMLLSYFCHIYKYVMLLTCYWHLMLTFFSLRLVFVMLLTWCRHISIMLLSCSWHISFMLLSCCWLLCHVAVLLLTLLPCCTHISIMLLSFPSCCWPVSLCFSLTTATKTACCTTNTQPRATEHATDGKQEVAVPSGPRTPASCTWDPTPHCSTSSRPTSEG